MQNKYEVIGIVGEGAYGIVMKCRNKETNEIVAIKKFKDGEEEIVQKSMLRELKVLKKLRHENIVQLKESFRRKGKLYLVFEYVDRNLLEILEQYPNGLDQQMVKRFIYQLCKSLIYIHNNDMIHRDIKPENILVTNDLHVKVCDFGFTRSLPQKGGILTDYVATRWYRAPELLLGCSNYGKEIDFWAVGCIMGEITDGKAMFPSENELEQLFMIQKLLGTLPQNMLEMFSSNPRFSGYKLDQVQKPETLERKYFGRLSKQAFAFMKSLMKLDQVMMSFFIHILMI
jgi:cyclin-dependent kinase-like